MARPKLENPKSQPLSLRLTSAQRDWLKEQEDLTGNDASATIRFLLAKAMSGPEPAPAVSVAPSPEELAAWAAQREAERRFEERQAKIAAKRAELEALERGEDPDDANPENYGDDPDPFDEGMLEEPASAPPPPKGPAFSVTRPAGVRADLRGGSVMGDAKGNIVRENFKWLG